MGLLLCALSILAQAAIIAAIFYLVIWAVGLIAGVAPPARVIQLLGLAFAIYILVALIFCFSSAGTRHLFSPWFG